MNDVLWQAWKIKQHPLVVRWVPCLRSVVGILRYAEMGKTTCQVAQKVGPNQTEKGTEKGAARATERPKLEEESSRLVALALTFLTKSIGAKGIATNGARTLLVAPCISTRSKKLRKLGKLLKPAVAGRSRLLTRTLTRPSPLPPPRYRPILFEPFNQPGAARGVRSPGSRVTGVAGVTSPDRKPYAGVTLGDVGVQQEEEQIQ